MVTNDGANEVTEPIAEPDAWMTLPHDADPDDVAQNHAHDDAEPFAPSEHAKPVRTARAGTTKRSGTARASSRTTDTGDTDGADPADVQPRKTTARRTP